MRIFAYIRMALQTLQRARARSALATSGVAVGVLAVVTLVSVGDAARTYVRDQFSGASAMVIKFSAGRNETRGLSGAAGGATRPITLEDVRFLRRKLGVQATVTELAITTGTLRFGNRSRSLGIWGVAPQFGDVYDMTVSTGTFISEEDAAQGRYVCVLGAHARTELFGSENAIGKYVELLAARFRVVGVLAPKETAHGADKEDIVVIPALAAVTLQHLSGVQIAVRAPAGEAIPNLMDQSTRLLASRHHGVDFTVVDPTELVNTINRVTGTLVIGVVAIGSIALFVGALGIANIMLLSVKERTKEIGVRRALGARRSDILLQFLIEAAAISAVGGILGVLIGGGAILGTRLAFNVPVQLSPIFVLAVTGFSAIVGIVAGLVPARRASAISPLEALRSD